MALHLPDNLPNIAQAKLPATYEAARASRAKCSSIDECRKWADKTAALPTPLADFEVRVRFFDRRRVG